MSDQHEVSWIKLSQDALEKEQLDIAILGSQGPKDLDILIVNRDGTLHSSYEMASRFLRLAQSLLPQDKCLIVRHEHRAFVRKGEPVLHLLYYPSYVHLASCELPSFIAYVHDKGRFLSGSPKQLSHAYSRYRKREPRLVGSQMEFQLLHYVEMAIMNLLYLCYNVNILSHDVYFENLIYLLRFSVSELLVNLQPINSAIGFWERGELCSFLHVHFPQFPKMTKLLSTPYPYLELPPIEQLQLLFLSLLKATDASFRASPASTLIDFARTIEDAI